MRSIFRQKDRPKLLRRAQRREDPKQAAETSCPTRLSSESPENRDFECDFYRNPTLLSRLILHRKYESAMRRLQASESRKEAMIWVCTKRKKERKGKPNHSLASSSSPSPLQEQDCQNYSFRQLPIHMACNNLTQTDDSHQQDVETVIVYLALAYPQGCARRDHQGRLPLHQAISNNANPDTISALLITAPETRMEPDKCGRYPLQLLKHNKSYSRRDKKKIRRMLMSDEDYWDTARQEFNLRMKHRSVPDASVSVTSTSVLADSTIEEGSTALTLESVKHQTRATFGDQNTKTATLKKMESIAWSQLETRAIDLEQRLSESLQQNCEMAKEVSMLKTANQELLAKCERLSATDLGQQVASLERETTLLRVKLVALERILQRRGESFEDERSETSKPSSIQVSLKGIEEPRQESSLQEHERLPLEVNQPATANQDMEIRLEYFERGMDNSSASTSSSVPEDTIEATRTARSKESSPESIIEPNDDADSVIRGAEEMYGQKLSSSIVKAWAATSSGALSVSRISLPSIAERSSDTESYTSTEDIEDLTVLLQETACMYNMSDPGGIGLNDENGLHSSAEAFAEAFESKMDNDCEESLDALLDEAAKIYGGMELPTHRT